MATALLPLALLASLCPTPQTQDPSRPLLVKATRIVVAPDTVLENDAILIRDGVVALVGAEIPEDAKRGARVVEFEGTVVPGFVNPHAHLSVGGDLAERISALTPELRAVDAYDPFDEVQLVHLRAGVTTVGLAPLSSNTFAGVAAVVKPGEIGTVIRDSSYLKLSLVDESLNQDRFPTSRMGAADLIRTSFDAARLATTGNDPKATALRDVLAGSTRLAIHARTHGSLTAALDLCQELGTAPLLIGADEADKSLERIAALGGSVILGPLTADSKLRACELPAKLEAAGIPFAFMADGVQRPATRSSAPRRPRGLPPGVVVFGPQPAPATTSSGPVPGHPESLRLSAAIAIRHGLSRRAALAALTRNPAAQCGVEDRCGSLRQGCDADFAVFSGDPLDLSSRLLAVYAAGRPIDLSAENNQR